MQIPRNNVSWPKSNNYVLVGSRAIVCVQQPPYQFLQTLHSLRMLKIVFHDSSLYPKQLSLFCLLRLINGSADRMGYITNFCSMIELLQSSQRAFLNMEGIRKLIVSQQGKVKTDSLLDFYA